MINPHLGEAPFSYEGKSYTMVFNHAAIVFFENDTGASFIEFQMAVDALRTGTGYPKMGHLVAFIRAALQKYHPETSTEIALAMLNEKSADVFAALGLSQQRSNPPVKTQATGGNARKTKAAAKPAAKPAKKPAKKPATIR